MLIGKVISLIDETIIYSPSENSVGIQWEFYTAAKNTSRNLYSSSKWSSGKSSATLVAISRISVLTIIYPTGEGIYSLPTDRPELDFVHIATYLDVDYVAVRGSVYEENYRMD